MVCPSLGRVPSSDDLLIKVTTTGVTLLAKFDESTGKYLPTGPTFRKRYTGSKTHAVDINGNLWLSQKELKEDSEADYRRFKGLPAKKEVKKKSTKDAPSVLQQVENTRTEQISAFVPTCAKKDGSFYSIGAPTPCYSLPVLKVVPVPAKKKRVKSYTINKKEVRARVHAYRNSANGKKHLYFFSISFPEGTPDAACYQAFNTWLTSLRKYRMLRDYLWVAERQDGKRLKDPTKQPTNTVHFHMLVPHYMNVHKANAMMRGTLKNLAKQGAMPGAMQSKVDGKKRTAYLNSLKNYNGVDLSKNRYSKRPINFALDRKGQLLTSYITKYVTKNDSTFEHLAWHNSRGFSGLFTGVTFTFKEFNSHKFAPYLNHLRVFSMNYATFIPWLFVPPPLLEDHLYKLNSYIQSITAT